MKKKKMVILLIVIFSMCLWLSYVNVFPNIDNIYLAGVNHLTSIAYRNNYQLNTTPMPQNIVADICKKLEIEKTSEHCIKQSTVYAPDFFDEIKEYFNNLPEEQRTYAVVDEKFGVYLRHCGETSSEGSYSCRYDFIGDGQHTFLFFFDKDNHYYEIIATVGGS